MSQASPALRQAALAVLDTVAAAIGEPLELDGNDQCGLEFDNDIEVVIGLTPSDDTLDVHARVASLGHQPSGEVMRCALAMNGGRIPIGMALAIEPHSGQLKVLARVRVLEIEPAAIISLLADLVALVPELRAELTFAAADGASSSAPAPPNPPLVFGGALRA